MRENELQSRDGQFRLGKKYAIYLFLLVVIVV